MNGLPIFEALAALLGYSIALYARFLGDVPARNFAAFLSFLPMLVAVYAIAGTLAAVRRNRGSLIARHLAALFVVMVAAYALRERIGALPTSVVALGAAFTVVFSAACRSFDTAGDPPPGSVLLIEADDKNFDLRALLSEQSVEVDRLAGDASLAAIAERLGSGAYHLALWGEPPADNDAFLNALFSAHRAGTRVVIPARHAKSAYGVAMTFAPGGQIVECAPRVGVGDMAKRIFDVAVTLIALPFAVPLTAVLALAVKIDSAGPAFYRQRRVGRFGEPFEMLKLRTMPMNVEAETGPMWPKENDPRATRVGRWLREFGLDELPQLLHVVTGTMSIVGPRPERLHFIERHAALGGRRLLATPGLTGLAQISLSKDAAIEEKIQLDLNYISARSLALDLKICMATVAKVVRRIAALRRIDSRAARRAAAQDAP